MTHRSLPTISIVTPNYNGADYLQDCMVSILQQDVEGLEYVVVDGASNDGSGAIIRQFASQLDATIIEPDDGHADAINKGFAKTSGEIMGWLNSDDVLFDGTLSFVQRLFAAYPEVEWITGRASSMNAAGDVTNIMPARPWSRVRMLAGDHAYIQQESTFWRRSLWERTGAGLDESLRLAVDFELWMRFFREAELHTVDRYLGCFRVRPGQRSVTQAKAYRAETLQVIQRELDHLEPDYRAAFGRLLPKQPIELSENEREQRNAELSICDPPILKPRDVNRRMLQMVEHSVQSASGGPASPDLFRTNDLSHFKDKHAGERCVILGNGPSLNQTDLSLLEGETVFASNGVFLLFDRVSWRPRYYACVDSRVLPDRAPNILAMLEAEPSITAFFPARLMDHIGSAPPQPARLHIGDGPNRYFVSERAPNTGNLPWSMFSPQPATYLVQPHTVTITLLQLAELMGFSEIILVGCDTSYRVEDSVEVGANDARRGIALTSTRNDDPNHFDPRYFGEGRRWHMPDLKAMIDQYQQARTALETRGVRVFNATVGGELEVFERIDLAEALARPRMSARTPGAAPVQPAAVRWASEPSALLKTFQNNLAALAAGAAGVLAAAALMAAMPTLTAAVAIASGFIALAALGLAGAVVIKTRRILLSLIKRIEAFERDTARQEIELVELNTRLDEAEFDKRLAAAESRRNRSNP